MNEKLKKIYTERSLLYKCPIDTYEKKGVTIIKEEKLRGKGYITIAHTVAHSFIRIDPSMDFPNENMQHLDKLMPDGVIELLESNYLLLGQELEPLYRYYYKLSDEQVRVETELEIRQIGSDESELLDEFFNRFSEDELDDADIVLDEPDPVIFGGFIDGELIAYSSHRYPMEGVADIGVIIDKNLRGRGFGKEIVAHDVNWCIKHDIVPKYVVLEKNIKSIKLVKSLGFEQLFTVYLLHITE